MKFIFGWITFYETFIEMYINKFYPLLSLVSVSNNNAKKQKEKDDNIDNHNNDNSQRKREEKSCVQMVGVLSAVWMSAECGYRMVMDAKR